ncbi:MAG: conjugal transfer protein TraF, partial [Arcobacteraceae bacterium]|nr:conjugal transfer protein TraF [Arcobacteraceae bacterium]
MNKNISLSLVTALSLTALNAYEMKPVGFKATGMGGTGVASTRGSLSGYYNPALLRFSDYTAEFSINAGFRLRESNLIEPMDKLSDLEIDGVIQRIGDNAGVIGADNTAKGDDEKMAESLAILKNIGSSNAFQVSLTPSLTAQMSDALAVGVYSTIDVSMRLNIDEGHLALIFKDGGNYYGYTPSSDTYTPGFTEDQYKTTSLEYANSEEGGINYIAVDTMALVEIPISYARAYDWDSGTWSFGLNFKPMALVTTTEKVSLGESSDDAEDSDDSTTETTYKSTFGLDLGVAYRPIDSKMTLGLVGKNINTPTFKVESTPAVGQMGHRSE